MISEYFPPEAGTSRDCAACYSSKVHALLIRQKNDFWDIKERLDEIDQGSAFGEPPKVTLIELNKDTTLLGLEDSSAFEQGTHASSFSLYGMVEHHPRRILSLNGEQWSKTEPGASFYSEAKDDAEDDGYSFDSKIEVVGQQNPWPDLKIISKGTFEDSPQKEKSLTKVVHWSRDGAYHSVRADID